MELTDEERGIVLMACYVGEHILDEYCNKKFQKWKEEMGYK